MANTESQVPYPYPHSLSLTGARTASVHVEVKLFLGRPVPFVELPRTVGGADRYPVE